MMTREMPYRSYTGADMIGEPFTRLKGTMLVAAHLPEQWRLPHLPREQLCAIRDERVRQIVRYAAETVPFYRDFFASQGIDPCDIQTAEDLEQLPLIGKDMVRSQAERFVSTSRWGREAVPFRSSGTTAQPQTVYHDKRSILLDSAFNERGRQVRRKLLGTVLGVRTLTIVRSAGTVHKVRAAQRAARFVPGFTRRMSVATTEPIEKVIAVVNAYRPHVINGYGSYLEVLFRTVKARGMKMHLPGVIAYSADAMTTAGRRLIEDEFGVPVLSAYTAVEAFKIGFTCEERTGLHLHDDLTHVRIVGPDGENLPTGSKGRVVISNLVNRGTVLLNYQMNDLAALSGETCPCGRTLRLLRGLEGRVEDILTLADGRLVDPRSVHNVLIPEGLLQYQLIQHSPARFELRLATVDRDTFELTSRSVVPSLQRLFGPSAKIEAVYYADRLPTGPGDKFRAVISHVRQCEDREWTERP
jgi:phenylacetate-CoA ligase